MGKGKKYEPTDEDYKFVEKALLDGATLRSIQKALGISNNTFKIHFESLESICKKEIDATELKLVKKSLFNKAVGFFIPSKVTKIKELYDPKTGELHIDPATGEVRTATETTITDKYIIPSDTAMIFYLGNRDSANWKSLNNTKEDESNNDTDFRIVKKIVHANKEEDKKNE